MKRLIIFAAAALLAVGTVSAQTPEEKQASADRIALLKQDAPKDCGIEKIDAAVAKSKSVAAATVAVSEVTATLTGESQEADLVALAEKIEQAATDLSDAGKVLGQAAAALKEVKNPMKLKSAKKSLDYAQTVVTTAGEELPYQGRVIAELVSGQ